MRRWLAANPALPPELLDTLADDVHEAVRLRVALNPTTAPATLTRLADGGSARVRAAAREQPRATVMDRHPDWTTALGLPAITAWRVPDVISERGTVTVAALLLRGAHDPDQLRAAFALLDDWTGTVAALLATAADLTRPR